MRIRPVVPLLLVAGTVVPLLAVPAAAAPVETRTIGYSAQGRAITAYRLGDPAGSNKVVVVGQIHGDEHAGVRTAGTMASSALVAPGSDVWVVPTMNPDGGAADRRTNGHGVDLNRNFPSGWRPTAAGSTWSGPAAASEPETRALMAFADAVDPRYLVTIHSPLNAVGLTPPGKDLAFAQRLGSALGLPVKDLAICSGTCAYGPGPSITSWFNSSHAGTAVTVEYPGWAPPTAYLDAAAVGVLSAAGAYSGSRINAHWISSGGAGGHLGPQTQPERPAGGGAMSGYRNGAIYWSPATGAHAVQGAIRTAWAAIGAERSVVGFPVTDEQGAAGGRYNDFRSGSVFWSPASGAHEVHGAIRSAWTATGRETGPLGFPVTGEHGVPGGRYNHFQNGSVYWSQASGAHEVYGAIRQAWVASGAESGPLGYPTTGEYGVAGGRAGTFSHGVVRWDAATGRTSVTYR